MVVQHNLTAMNSNRMLGLTTSALSKSTEKLSSGYKINRAADDAAGLSISEKMRRQIRGLTQASSNAEDGISCVQTAEGAMSEVQDMLQRVNELAVKGENGTLTSVDRSYIQSEVGALLSEIDRVASTTTFNEQNLLDGTFTNKNLQVGAESAQYISISITGLKTKKLANTGKTQMVGSKTVSQMLSAYVTGSLAAVRSDLKTKLSTASGVIDRFFGDSKSVAQSGSITAADFGALNIVAKGMLQQVSKQRSDLGAIQNRLEHTIANLDNIVENTTSAESQIRDTDMATEMVKYSNSNILAQAGQSMLAQANQSNQGVLSLLQG